MNIILGLCVLAISNKLFTNFSDSPSHLDTRSDDDTEKNVELFASVATALAKYDLPVPGGYNVQLLFNWQAFLPNTGHYNKKIYMCRKSVQ